MNEEQNRDQLEQVEVMTQEMLLRLDLLTAGDLRGEISLSQFRMLSTIHKRGPISIGGIAQELILAQSTTSEMVTRLLKSGLATKTRGEFDNRVVTVELTDQGRQALKRRCKIVREAFRRLDDKLSPSERDVFMNALKQLDGLLRKTEE